MCKELWAGFPTLGILTLGMDNPLFLGACPVHCGMFSNISGLHPLDARSTLHSAVTTNYVSRHSQTLGAQQFAQNWVLHSVALSP